MRLTVKVGTQRDVKFEAFVKGTGERITVNDRDTYFMSPTEERGEATVLQIPESPGICQCINHSGCLAFVKAA